MMFKDKVVLITGGSRGIGRACALGFAQEGAKVVIGYAGNEAAAAETLKQMEPLGNVGTAQRFDVVDPKACAGAVDGILKQHGRLDVLVNNAGVAVDGLVMRFSDEDWNRVLDTNLKSAFSLIRAVSRPMMKQKGGAIVNVTSVVGEMGNAGQAAYSASKAGLIGLTRSVARELASRSIRVNAVSPGFIDTDMTSAIPEASRTRLLEGIPLGHLGSATDVANAVLFLSSDKARYITGEVLKVNGGLYM